MRKLWARTGQTGSRVSWARRNAGRLSAAAICAAAAASFAAGVAPGIGWVLLVFGMALAAEAFVSR